MRLRLLIVWALLLAGIVCLAQQPRAQYNSFPPGVFTGRAALDASASGCSQATTFLGRTSGLSGTESSAYTTMICGLVTDSIITGTMAGSGTGATACGSLIDALYIFATNTTTTANLNLCSTSFGLTANNSPTFTADAGYTGNGSNSYLDSGYVPSTAGGNYTQNSASTGVCVLTSSTSGALDDEMGSRDGALIENLDDPGAGFFSALNSSGDDSAALSNTQGFFIASRTGASAGEVYKNGSSYFAITQTTSALPTSSIFILATHSGGSPAVRNTSHQLGAAFWGAQLTATQVSNIRSRISTYLSAFSLSGC